MTAYLSTFYVFALIFVTIFINVHKFHLSGLWCWYIPWIIVHTDDTCSIFFCTCVVLCCTVFCKACTNCDWDVWDFVLTKCQTLLAHSWIYSH